MIKDNCNLTCFQKSCYRNNNCVAKAKAIFSADFIFKKLLIYAQSIKNRYLKYESLLIESLFFP